MVCVHPCAPAGSYPGGRLNYLCVARILCKVRNTCWFVCGASLAQNRLHTYKHIHLVLVCVHPCVPAGSDPGGRLNHLCGADFVQKERLAPVGFSSLPTSTRCNVCTGCHALHALCSCSSMPLVLCPYRMLANCARHCSCFCMHTLQRWAAHST